MHSRLIRKKILGHENHAWWWCKKNDCKRHEMAADVGQTENAITEKALVVHLRESLVNTDCRIDGDAENTAQR